MNTQPKMKKRLKEAGGAGEQNYRVVLQFLMSEGWSVQRASRFASFFRLLDRAVTLADVYAAFLRYKSVPRKLPPLRTGRLTSGLTVTKLRAKSSELKGLYVSWVCDMGDGYFLWHYKERESSLGTTFYISRDVYMQLKPLHV